MYIIHAWSSTQHWYYRNIPVVITVFCVRSWHMLNFRWTGRNRHRHNVSNDGNHCSWTARVWRYPWRITIFHTKEGRWNRASQYLWTTIQQLRWTAIWNSLEVVLCEKLNKRRQSVQIRGLSVLRLTYCLRIISIS